MAKEMYFGKNVSLRQKNFETIAAYMNRTKKNFSQTLNIIIEQWDKFSIIVQRLQEEQEINKLKEAKILHEQINKEVKK